MMKKLTSLFCLCLALNLIGQETDTVRVAESDTTMIDIGNTRIIIIGNDSEANSDTVINWDSSDDDLTWWDGIDVGVNGYFFGENFDVDPIDGQEHLEINYAGSRSFSLNFAETKIKLIDNYVGLVTGLGLQYQSYKFQNDYTLGLSGDSIVAFMDTTINLRKNKLRTGYLVIPLLLEFNTSKDADRSFHLSGGVVGGINLGNKYKQKFEVLETGEREKVKVKSKWDVAPFKLDAMARVGYGDFSLFASYALTDMFRSESNPQLRPFSAGLTLNF
ncbi:MAG: outer membrane beta-barrel protein [Bacteroidota bacterium]